MRLLYVLLALCFALSPVAVSAESAWPPTWPLTLDVTVSDCSGAGLPDNFELEYNSGTSVHLKTDAEGRFNEILAAPHAASSFRLIVRSLVTDWYTTTEFTETFNLCYVHLPYISAG